MDTCDFMDKLPTEIRTRIYEFCLTFASPIKIRYILPGSKDLPLLRLNRQICEGALPVLYERNRIVIKYAHFCKYTPPESKSPINPEYIRHLLIDGLGRSIICGSRDYLGCEVCSGIDASELASNLQNFPRLRTVVFNYEGHRPEMDIFKESLQETPQFQLVSITNPDLSFMYKLQGPELGDVSVEFRRTLHKWVDHAVQDKLDWLQKS